MIGDDLDLPFESQEPTPHSEEYAMSGGVVVIAAVAPTLLGPLPIIIFRFAHADGSGFMPPIALGISRSQLEDLPGLITAAMTRALEAAGQ